MLPSEKGHRKGSQKPTEVVKRMLSKTYDDLDVKDMSRDAFVNECMGAISEKMKSKKSNIILPEGF